MNAIYLLIPLSIVFLLLAMAVFLWAAKSKQFDDLDTPAMSILLDDERPSSIDKNVENRPHKINIESRRANADSKSTDRKSAEIPAEHKI